MNEQPIIFRWTGETFEPSTNYQAHLAGQRFAEGELVPLVEFHERSPESHKHYFATLHDLWMNLPEHLSKEFPTPEHLRKHALIREGYADKRSLVCRSAAEAERTAAFVRPLDSYAIITVEAATVVIWTAQSQSHRAMGKRVFQESKDKVLEWAAALCGVDLTDPDPIAHSVEAA
jgi:hypothetical protein